MIRNVDLRRSVQFRNAGRVQHEFHLMLTRVRFAARVINVERLRLRQIQQDPTKLLVSENRRDVSLEMIRNVDLVHRLDCGLIGEGSHQVLAWEALIARVVDFQSMHGRKLSRHVRLDGYGVKRSQER